MALFGLFGKKNKDAFTLSCVVIGEDKNVMHRNSESTGSYVFDRQNLLAYDSFPECIGRFMRFAKKKRKYLGQTTLLYENMARPFSFKHLTWIEIKHKEDQIKNAALSEGCSKAVERLDFADRFDKMMTILLLAVAGVIGIALIFAFQSGLFQKITGK